MGKLTISMAIFNSYAKLPECISDLLKLNILVIRSVQNKHWKSPVAAAVAHFLVPHCHIQTVRCCTRQCQTCNLWCAQQVCFYKCLSISQTPWGSYMSPGLPHVTTLPSAKTASKGRSVAWICWTLLSWSLTPVLSPPLPGQPHVTTLPSTKLAATAKRVAWICWTL